jgi:hypothetical protein
MLIEFQRFPSRQGQVLSDMPDEALENDLQLLLGLTFRQRCMAVLDCKVRYIATKLNMERTINLGVKLTS